MKEQGMQYPRTGFRVVIDTNVLLSSLCFPEKRLSLVWRCAAEGRYVLVSSPALLREFKKKLQEKFSSERDVKDFLRFVGVAEPEELRQVTPAHVIAWRKRIEERGAVPSTIRRKLAALSAFFDSLRERNAVFDNPVRGVKRLKANTNEGLTPAIGDAQARMLLSAPPEYVEGQMGPGDSGDASLSWVTP